MPNEPTAIRPLRIVAPATAQAEPPPADPVRSARFRSLMTAASEPRRPAADAAEDQAFSQAAFEQTDEPADATKPEANYTIAIAQGPALGATEQSAQRDETSSLPKPDHTNLSSARKRIAPKHAQSFPARGVRPLMPHAALASEVRMLSSDTLHEENNSRLEILTAHLSSMISFASAGREECAVAIKLDPKIIDETTVHVSISRSRLSLRFQSPLLASRTLIYTHADGLAARLESRVKRPTSIAVTA
ncbi:type III secretion HpaP family protein [Paraburkholderia xenovorans]|uniref:type III secretion HpaP family protein n=1 Tax=Paraburkholderia xenovorans TaxID=36873 RepID=UPI0038B7F5EF